MTRIELFDIDTPPDSFTGKVLLIDNHKFVCVGGITRGAETIFLTDEFGTLFYIGQNPEYPSDGMELQSPWNEAEELEYTDMFDTGEIDHKTGQMFGEINWDEYD